MLWFHVSFPMCIYIDSHIGIRANKKKKYISRPHRSPNLADSELPSNCIIPTMIHGVELTLPETNSSPLQMDGWNTGFLLGNPIFRLYVSFREGTCLFPSQEMPRITSFSVSSSWRQALQATNPKPVAVSKDDEHGRSGVDLWWDLKSRWLLCGIMDGFVQLKSVSAYWKQKNSYYRFSIH